MGFRAPLPILGLSGGVIVSPPATTIEDSTETAPLFRIDVFDANDNKVGTGPLTNIASITRRRSLDEMGGVTIRLPAIDRKTSVIGAGNKYRVIHHKFGDLGLFTHAEKKINISSGAVMLDIKADDELIELMRKNVYFRRSFNNEAIDSVVSTLLGLVSGWGGGAIKTGINTSVTYEGESVFEAIDVLRDRWGVHFRLGNNSRTLDFGDFGVSSGIRLIRPDNIPKELYGNDNVALITSLEIVSEEDAIINRLIPVGAGAGTTQLTLENVTAFDPSYPVKTGTNADGSNFYYIEDTASIGTHGLIERPFERNDIRPLTNSTTNLENAANALYNSALNALLKWREGRTHYNVSVTKLDTRKVKPGDKVRIFFRGIATYQGLPYKWVDIDTDLWVIDITESYGPDGGQDVSLSVASTASRRTSDSDVITRLVRDAKVFKTHVQPNLTHSPVNGRERINPNNSASFEIRLQDEVLAVNRVLMRFVTRPLRSSIESIAGTSATIPAGGGGTSAAGAPHSHEAVVIQRILVAALNSNHKQLYINQNDGSIVYATTQGGLNTIGKTSDSENSHNHSIQPHTHQFTPELSTNYGLFEDSQHPQNISVTLNGADRTTILGGPWAATNAPVSVELDITEYIKRGQVNTVVFTCTGGRGEIEFLADTLLTIQAIAVTQ